MPHGNPFILHRWKQVVDSKIQLGKEKIAMPDNKILLMVILHHDQSKTSRKLWCTLRRQDFTGTFRRKGQRSYPGCGYVFWLHYQCEGRGGQDSDLEPVHGAEGVGSLSI